MLEDKSIDKTKLNKPIPTKRYFTISEVSELCQVKPHVLRYWEQEFNKLRPNKRGNRRYYQYDEVLLVRKIRDLLYGQLFTIKGARAVLEENSGRSSLNKPTLAENPMQRTTGRHNAPMDLNSTENPENGDLFFYPSASAENAKSINTPIDASSFESEIRSIMMLLAPKEQELKT